MKLISIDDSVDNLELYLSRVELLLFSNAVGEIINGPYSIDENEFQTLIGLSKSEAILIQKEINSIWIKLSP